MKSRLKPLSRKYSEGMPFNSYEDGFDHCLWFNAVSLSYISLTTET